MAETLNATLERLDRGKGSPYSAVERADIERLYFRVMGRAMLVSSCPNRWADAVVEMRIFLRKNKPRNDTMKASKYIMKRGVILRYGGNVYSAATITDEVAEKALKENPNVAWMFSSIPEGAEEPVEAKPEPVEAAEEPKEAEEPKAAEEPEQAEEPKEAPKTKKKAKK